MEYPDVYDDDLSGYLPQGFGHNDFAEVSNAVNLLPDT